MPSKWPAISPAIQFNKIVLETAAPATYDQTHETSPSFEPKTAALNAFPPTDLWRLSNLERKPQNI
jgi:hypothetical protein